MCGPACTGLNVRELESIPHITPKGILQCRCAVGHQFGSTYQGHLPAPWRLGNLCDCWTGYAGRSQCPRAYVRVCVCTLGMPEHMCAHGEDRMGSVDAVENHPSPAMLLAGNYCKVRVHAY